MKKFIVYTDGASRGNPGHAAAGFVIKDETGLIWIQQGVYLDVTTNNVAEYTAVKLALQKLVDDFLKYLPTQVTVRTDSLLLVEQLNGRYKIKNPNLKILFEQIRKLEKKIGQVSFVHITRADNFLADRLANQALDAKLF